MGLPFLLTDIDHLRAQVDERQAVDGARRAQVVVADVPAGAAGHFQDVASALLREGFANSQEPHEAFRHAHFAVEAVGRVVVDARDVFLAFQVAHAAVLRCAAGGVEELRDVEAHRCGEDAHAHPSEGP